MKPSERMAIAAAVLLVYWVALPLHLPQSPTQLSNGQCLAQADTPPADGPGLLLLLEQCSALLPTDVELAADLGGAYERAGRWSSAEATYRRALTIDPQYADLRRRLATIMLRRGARDEAKEQIQAALRIQPNRQTLLELLHEADGSSLP